MAKDKESEGRYVKKERWECGGERRDFKCRNYDCYSGGQQGTLTEWHKFPCHAIFYVHGILAVLNEWSSYLPDNIFFFFK